MDINALRSLFTVLIFGIFVGIVWWAYSARRKSSFDEAALLPLNDDDQLGTAGERASVGQRDN